MKYGLFFGVNNYTHGITPLTCARNDALAFFRTFKAEGYEGRLLTDAPAGMTQEDYKNQLLSEGFASSDIQVCKMTSEELRRALNEIPEMKAGDLLVIFFSGHGFEIGNQNFLIGSDADAAWMNNSNIPGAVPLAGICRCTNFPGVLRLLILDCCRNNPFEGGRALYTCSSSRNLELEDLTKAQAEKSLLPPVIITSCSTNERAYEDKKQGLGYFSKSFLKTLQDKSINSFETFIRSVLSPIRVPDAGLQTPWICGNLSQPIHLLERWKTAANLDHLFSECKQQIALTDRLLKLNNKPLPQELISLRADIEKAKKENDCDTARRCLDEMTGKAEKIRNVQISESAEQLEQFAQLFAKHANISSEKFADLKERYDSLRKKGFSRELLDVLQAAYGELLQVCKKITTEEKQCITSWLNFLKENKIPVPDDLKKYNSAVDEPTNAGEWQRDFETLSSVLDKITSLGESTARKKISEARDIVEKLEQNLPSVPGRFFRLKAEASHSENLGNLHDACRKWQKIVAELSNFADEAFTGQNERLRKETIDLLKFLSSCNREFKAPRYDLKGVSPENLPPREFLEYRQQLYNAAILQAQECARELFEKYNKEIQSAKDELPREVWEYMFQASEAEKAKDFSRARAFWESALKAARSRTQSSAASNSAPAGGSSQNRTPHQHLPEQPVSVQEPVQIPSPVKTDSQSSKWTSWIKTPFIGYLKLIFFWFLFMMCVCCFSLLILPVGVYLLNFPWDKCLAAAWLIGIAAWLFLGGLYFNKFFTVITTATITFLLLFASVKAFGLSSDNAYTIATPVFWLLYPVFNWLFSRFTFKKKKLHWSILLFMALFALAGLGTIVALKKDKQNLKNSRHVIAPKMEICCRD